MTSRVAVGTVVEIEAFGVDQGAIDRLSASSLLFPAAVADRLVSKARGRDDIDLKLPAAPLNTALERTFAAERHLIGRVAYLDGQKRMVLLLEVEALFDMEQLAALLETV